MSQFGMHMAGAQRKRAPSPDVYTGLMVIGCVFLAVACAVLYREAGKVGKGGSPFGIQDKGANQIQLPAEAPR
jgi:hypothetical protein